MSLIPNEVPNWINGKEEKANGRESFLKVNPANGATLCQVTRSRQVDIHQAVDCAKRAQPAWAALTPVKRGMILHDVALALRTHREEVATVVALETGKSMKDALGETDGAVALGFFMAGEGQRMYGRTTTSGVPHRMAMTVRQPLGVAGLIIAANTPIANVAWKVFPALICGNTAVLKAAEDTPTTAWIFGRLAHEAGLPPGVLNIMQGFGEEAGEPIVAHPDIAVISFTGSTEVGRRILSIAGQRLAKVSLELGGKNALVVCDDADLEQAVNWTVLSAFSNAGQRCASASRVIVLAQVYDQFRELLLEKAGRLKVGPNDTDDFGPVINEDQLLNMLKEIEQAKAEGASILMGGARMTDGEHNKGFYLGPTILENVSPDARISTKELFGPITCLYRASDFEEAIDLANASPYGLTASIHTRSLDRACVFTERVQVGAVSVNGGTYGSEPHMPFGGVKQSGNGTREPGTEALDIYSNLKDVYIHVAPNRA